MFLTFAITSASGDAYDDWGPKNKSGFGYYARIGYVLGGTAPLPIPSEIRRISTFTPDGGLMFGLDGFKMLDKYWGILIGAHISPEGMKTKADVKNYHIGITQDNNYLTGYYTGTNKNNVSLLALTIPIEVMYRVTPRLTLRGGPYFQLLLDRTFEGSVYNGYLRENTPTGQKIEISANNPAVYDFAKEMRKTLWGVEVGADWKVMKKMSIFGQIDWGMNGIFRNGFETIDFTMYPIFMTVGIALAY